MKTINNPKKQTLETLTDLELLALLKADLKNWKAKRQQSNHTRQAA